MRISDWSSDVCSSDLIQDPCTAGPEGDGQVDRIFDRPLGNLFRFPWPVREADLRVAVAVDQPVDMLEQIGPHRSEEHTSELQSLMRISYAVFCLKKKKHNNSKQDDGLPHTN